MSAEAIAEGEAALALGRELIALAWPLRHDPGIRVSYRKTVRETRKLRDLLSAAKAT